MIPLNRPPVGELFESLEDKKKHPSHEASVQAIKTEKSSGRHGRNTQKVIEIMRANGGDMTAREIHLIMQQEFPLIQGNNVSARMSELKKDGTIYMVGTRMCQVTKMTKPSWKLK